MPRSELVAETLARVIQRADELAEFVAIYGRTGACRFRRRSRRGWLRRSPSSMSTPRPSMIVATDQAARRAVSRSRQAARCGAGEVWKRLIAEELTVPDTWEVALSSGADKREAWERLLREQKLGALALLRNLRNMREAGVEEDLVLAALRSMNAARVLPFRFLAAARYAPQWEEALEQAMLKCVASQEKLDGQDGGAGRCLRLDDCALVSPFGNAAHGRGLWTGRVAARDRQKVAVFSFSDKLVEVPARRGFWFARRHRRFAAQQAHGLGKAVDELDQKHLRTKATTA